MGKSVIVVGPQGSGKSLNAGALLGEFDLQTVVELDDVLFGLRAERLEPTGQLILTCDAQQARTWSTRWGLEVVHVDQVRARLGAAWRTSP
ncbi:hypothetical protein [Xanthomonas citri]|uniref:hypothetical protein n=1 Tax=Xanthomonas citri TaxID=346 RepID=UPI0002FC7463|nr:hypothetical protein [Xanthomonas citri]AMU99474.1 hypothetical protein TP37_16335 [Xanthomonas citri pv. aurantifolii]AMV03981.1 hypothetical protein TP50_17235 [Xanthomonas citri pv. aurantifolii]MCC8490607.1 hypothetical protein [Xanthomonas citri pv. fuscans]TBW93791.1 hypothetical protein TP47_20265 [Xanthomonas citri pv. aurantifolii]TBW94124.1 hypothetical protein TP49_19875 [Xanthomonas citri pv. aurantifolii]